MKVFSHISHAREFLASSSYDVPIAFLRSTGVDMVGLSQKETNQYSLLKAILASSSRDWSRAGLEAEVSRTIFQKSSMPNVSSYAFAVPAEVLMRDLSATGGGSAGGFLVGTENRPQNFIEIKRNTSVVLRMGATVLTDLGPNVTIPRQTGTVMGQWLPTETTQITESQMVLGQIALTPKTVGAYTEVSRQLILQGSLSVEELVMRDLAMSIAIQADLAAITGSGASGQPTGILNTSGVGAVTGASLDYADVLEFQTDLASANTLSETCGYVTTPAVAATLKARTRFASTDSPLWDGNVYRGTVEGFRAMSSNQVPSGTMIFGDFSHLLIGEWGRLVVDVNPFANFQAGILGLRSLYSMDVAVRYPGAFSVATSIT